MSLIFQPHCLLHKPQNLIYFFFPFYVRKNSWGSWDFNNKLIKMKNKTEKLCRLGPDCHSISNLSNHLCPRSWTKIFLESVISLFGSKDTVITVLLFPFLLHYSLRAQYSGTTKIKTKSIQSILNLKDWILVLLQSQFMLKQDETTALKAGAKYQTHRSLSFYRVRWSRLSFHTNPKTSYFQEGRLEAFRSNGDSLEAVKYLSFDASAKEISVAKQNQT